MVYRRAVAVALCTLVLACASDGPTTPTPTPAPAPAPSSVSLSGRIFDAGNGVPVAGNVLILGGTNQGRSTHADAEGNYRLSDLQPGTFTVFAGLTNYASIEREISLSADTTLDFPLTLLVATLSGRVTDTATGTAL